MNNPKHAHSADGGLSLTKRFGYPTNMFVNAMLAVRGREYAVLGKMLLGCGTGEQTMNDDLIKRSDAIEAIENTDWYHQNKNKDMVSGATAEHQAWYKAEDIYKALEAVPTADKPQDENSSENPNNCETCRFELYCPEMCEGCCEWDSHYEPKEEPKMRPATAEEMESVKARDTPTRSPLRSRANHRRTVHGSEVAMFWSGMLMGVFIGMFLMIPIVFAVGDSETVHAIDHRLAEKIKGDEPDIDIDIDVR